MNGKGVRTGVIRERYEDLRVYLDVDYIEQDPKRSKYVLTESGAAADRELDEIEEAERTGRKYQKPYG